MHHRPDHRVDKVRIEVSQKFTRGMVAELSRAETPKPSNASQNTAFVGQFLVDEIVDWL